MAKVRADMVLEFIKSAEGTRYLMPRKGLKITVQNNDRDLETLAFQSFESQLEVEHMAYLAVYHHKCVRVFSVRDELVDDGLRQAMQLAILPAICADNRKKRAAGSFAITAAVLFDGKVYAVPCGLTGRFPTLADVQAFIAENPQPICDVNDYPLPEEEEEV